jgi:beta-glucuronidase
VGRVPQRAALRCGDHRAAVGVGDEMVDGHEGGYTPFEADLPSIAVPGEALRITIVVNNELHFPSIPPGVIQELPDGSGHQRCDHDFFNYSGLHRSGWLYATPRCPSSRSAA